MRKKWALIAAGAVLLAAVALTTRSLWNEDGAPMPALGYSKEVHAQASLGLARRAASSPSITAQDESVALAEPAQAVAGGAATTTARLAASQAPRPDRLLIRNATISIEVKDARAAAAALTRLVEAQRGYVGNLSESVDALGARTVSVEVRVPYVRFEQTSKDVRSLGKLLDMKVTAEDVTEEFTDANARLRNLKVTQARLLDLLRGSRRLQDTLAVEREVSRVQGESDEIEGRLRFLVHRIAYSTFDVTLSETPRERALVPPQTFSSANVAGAASRSMVAFVLAVWEVVIWVAVWAAVWLPIVLVAWAVRRYARRAAAGKA